MNLDLKQQLNGAKVLAHFMGWFQSTAGAHIGMYNSDDPRVVRNQIWMAKKLGIEGFVLDWYGPENDLINHVALQLMVQCEAEDFEFSLMLDAGMFRGITKALPGASINGMKQDALHKAITYAQDNFTSSHSYTRLNSRPLFWEFRIREGGIDTNLLFTKFPTLTLLSQTTPIQQSAGTFAWVDPKGGVDSLRSYLTTPNPIGIQVPCVFYGFDDHLASWSENRLLSARNGDTWTECIKTINAAGRFPLVQLLTWNDYEEGTAIEPYAKALTGMSLL